MPLPWHHEDHRVRIRKLCVGGMENNVYLVACARTGEAVIVDAADEADRIRRETADLRPRMVLTTHGHRDHVQAASVAGELGIPFALHPEDGPLAGIRPDHPLEDGMEIEVGDLALTALHVPGHTPGSTCFLLNGHLFSGDTLFPGGPGATPDRKAFARIMEGLEDHLFTLPDETLVHPGHGLDTTIGTERPHLEEWRARGW